MTERRRAVRREPIEVEIEDGRVFIARPLPWFQANDLGNEILKQNTEGTNETVRMYMDGNIPQLETMLGVKIKDWKPVLALAFPENKLEDFEQPRSLDVDECAELVLASLEVNHLEHLKTLVDPNSPSPTETGGQSSSVPEGMEPGEKTESTPNSFSEVSPATPS